MIWIVLTRASASTRPIKLTPLSACACAVLYLSGSIIKKKGCEVWEVETFGQTRIEHKHESQYVVQEVSEISK